MNRNTQPGFTLIELIIVVAIVGILAAIAFASYGDNVTSARRTDGRAALLDNATRLEKCKATYGVYNNVACTITVNSTDNFYTVAVDFVPVINATSFTLTATPIGVQANDAECVTMTLSNTGLEGGTPLINECW